MHVNSAQSPSRKPVKGDALHRFDVRRHLGCRQGTQLGEDHWAIFEVAARQFAGNERVHQYKSFGQAAGQARMPAAKVFDPDGGIGEDHQTGRRRGTPDSLGCVPPSAASLLPVSRAISAARPSRTKAVFS